MEVEHRRHVACEACRARKVRCNGEYRCQQCNHLDLQCVYPRTNTRQKRLARGKLIAQQRGSLPKGELRALVAHQHDKLGSNDSLPAAPGASIGNEDAAFFAAFLCDYETYVYPFHPIVPIDEVQDCIRDMGVNLEARAFVYSLVAVSMNFTHSLRLSQASSAQSDPSERVAYWISRSLKAMTPVLQAEDVTVRRITTVQWLHVCLTGLQSHELAFYYLRQSVSMVQMLHVEDARTLLSMNSAERARRERLYWGVFVHERYYAIAHQRTVVLSELASLPSQDDSIPYAVHHGFLQIIRLFRLIDNDLLAKWLATSNEKDTQHVPAEWISKKHREIDAECAGNDKEIAGLSEMQQADLVITKHWIRMLVWQVALEHCFLSSKASDVRMSLLFPVGVSSRLRELLAGMSRQAIEVQGPGIQRKLFELTDTIANVILTVPASSTDETKQRAADFKFLHVFWNSLPRPHVLQQELLQDKAEKLERLAMYEGPFETVGC